MDLADAVVRLKQANLLAKVHEDRIIGGRSTNGESAIKVYQDGFAIWPEAYVYHGGIADNGNLGTRTKGTLDDVVAFLIERYFPKVLDAEKLPEKNRYRVRLIFGTFDVSVSEVPELNGVLALDAPSDFYQGLYGATFDAAGMRAVTNAVIKACVP